MKKKFIYFPLFILITTFACGKLEGTNPPLVALDINDENGLQIFKKHPTCDTYKKIGRGERLYLMPSNSAWTIFKNLDEITYECNPVGGTILFQHKGGQKLKSEKWYDFDQETYVTLSLYALDECTIYKGAYVVDDYDRNPSISGLSENLKSCISKKKYDPFDRIHVFSTRSHAASNQLSCNVHISYDFFSKYSSFTKVILTDDENARVVLAKDKNCITDPPQTIMDISEARATDHSNSEWKWKDSESRTYKAGKIKGPVVFEGF